MKVDKNFTDLCDEIAEYDTDIWNNPKLWTKKEWHMYDLFLYHVGFGWWKRCKAKKLMKKAIREQKKKIKNSIVVQSDGDVRL